MSNQMTQEGVFIELVKIQKACADSSAEVERVMDYVAYLYSITEGLVDAHRLGGENAKFNADSWSQRFDQIALTQISNGGDI